MSGPSPGDHDETVATAGPECKRRRRNHDLPKPEAPAVAEEDLDASQPDWWKPQPHATLDENEYQERPAAPLSRALSCRLCGELLREAMTAPECGHTYCYDCIESRVEIGGNHNVCPVPGCGCVLGPNPFDHHRLLYDCLLDGLVRKVFPRPALDAALAARRAEREEATRRAREALNAHGGGHHHHHHQQQHHDQHHDDPNHAACQHPHRHQLQQQREQGGTGAAAAAAGRRSASPLGPAARGRRAGGAEEELEEEGEGEDGMETGDGADVGSLETGGVRRRGSKRRQ